MDLPGTSSPSLLENRKRPAGSVRLDYAMPLSTGDKLGPYEIVSPIGEGGMGEVYKARDTRLERSVAIKVLPEHIAKREDLRARFEREARAVASLNHPNICVVHDIGSQDGHGYMVMEYMEGETLAARIAKGALPLEQALKFAVQIADALDRAHRAGVTHRDVKPANIMLTRDGVKVLDFGLAKSSASQKPGPEDATIVAGLTTEGTILGTPQYMAPEQFEGKEADARADIWAFGAVLYEMVTGQKAFQGKNYSSLIASILAAEPPPMTVEPFTPVWLERLVRRCLAKDPEDRWQSMRDIVLELRTPPQDAVTVAAPRPSRWLWIASVAVMTLIAILGWGLWLRKTSEPVMPAKFDVNPPPGSRFASIGGTGGGSAISPDGRTLAFVATNAKGVMLLHIRPLESLEAQALPGTDGAGRPFWSPDSKSIGFGAQGKLKRIDLSGGRPMTLCDLPFARGGTWSEDGQILFADRDRGLKRIAATGGTPVAVTTENKQAGERNHYYPQYLPGGKQFLYLVRYQEEEKNAIFVGSMDGKAAVKVVESGYRAVYDASTKRLLYMQGVGVLMSRKLELDPPRLSGEAVTVAEGIRVTINNRYAEYSVSGNGTLYYGRGSGIQKVQFVWRDRAGKQLEVVGQPVEASFGYSLSPDGSRVAYGASSSGGPLEVWVLELARGISTRITFNGGRSPEWSPDGKQLYYMNGKGIQRKAADGSGGEELLLQAGVADIPTGVSPDGKVLLYGNVDIRKLSLSSVLSGEQKSEAYLETKYREGLAVFSPDGRWVAYYANESGRHEIYVEGYPERRGKWLVSSEGGTFPQWRGDGKELYWSKPDGTLMAASMVLQAGGVPVGRAEPLFRATGQGNYFRSAKDGKRFLVAEAEGSQQELPMVVQLNYAARLGK